MDLPLRYKLLGVVAAAGLLYSGWTSVRGEFTDDYGMTGLMRAAAAGDAAEARRLLDLGARLNRQVPSDDLEAFLALLRFFQEYPANKIGWTALMFSVHGGHATVARALLDEGADPNLVARDGETALRIAVQQGAVDLVRLLIDKGAKPDAGGLMLCAATRLPHGEEIARLLLGAGVDPNARGSDGQTPLIMAVRNVNVPLVRLLIDAKADLQARDLKPGWTAHMWALHLANPGVLEVFGPTGVAGAAAGAEDPDFLLIRAILGGDGAGAKAALARGAQPHATSEEGEPALFLAARRGQTEAVQALLAAGASVHLEFRTGTALSAAVSGRNPDTVREIVAARPGARALQEALRQAAVYGQTDVAKLLLDGGASPVMGDYPLVQQSVRFGDAALIKLLLDAGADPNLKGEGQTPLIDAVSYGKTEIVGVLLAAGADPRIPDARGKLPMDFVNRSLQLAHAPEDYKARYRQIGEMLQARLGP
jgi:uncharacterized protein